MIDYKKTPENREIKTAVEQGQLAVIEMRKHAVIEAAYYVALHERSYYPTPAPIHAIVETDLGVQETALYNPEVQPLQPQIQDTVVNISGRPDANIEEARRKVYEALAA